jgi:hypothetical protein
VSVGPPSLAGTPGAENMRPPPRSHASLAPSFSAEGSALIVEQAKTDAAGRDAYDTPPGL